MVTTLDIAKIFVDGTGHDFGLDRTDFEAEIHKMAAATRPPGSTESRAQGFTRISTQTEAGKILFKAAVRGKPPVQAAQDFMERTTKPSPGPASEELAALARKLARERRISYQQAYSRLFESEAHRDLRDRIKAEEAEATRAVRDQRKPIWTAERELEADFSLGVSRGSGRL
jgi:hypothetical protein